MAQKTLLRRILLLLNFSQLHNSVLNIGPDPKSLVLSTGTVSTVRLENSIIHPPTRALSCWSFVGRWRQNNIRSEINNSPPLPLPASHRVYVPSRVRVLVAAHRLPRFAFGACDDVDEGNQITCRSSFVRGSRRSNDNDNEEAEEQ